MGTADVTFYAVFATQIGEGSDVLSRITDVAQVEEGIYAIITYDESFYLSNAKSTTTLPVSSVTKNGDEIVIEDAMKWTLAIDNEDYILKSNASTAEEELYLWGAPTNDGVRVVKTSTKTNPFNTWQLKSTNNYGLVLCHNVSGTTYRFLSTYGKQDWRNYESTTSTNYAANLYKFVPGKTYSDFTTTIAAPAPNHGTLNFVATTGDGKYYATFCSDRAIKFDEAFINEEETCLASIKAYAVAVVGGEIYRTDQYEVNNDGNYTYIPAKTAVLFEYVLDDGSEFDGAVPYEYADAEAEYLNSVEDNMLRPASVAKETDGSYQFYKLAYGDWDNKKNLGFWWGAENGGVFESKEGGVYLAVPVEPGSNMRGFSFDAEGTPTAIESIANAAVAGEIFNLQGQRIQRLQQGVNIVNGRKVIR